MTTAAPAPPRVAGAALVVGLGLSLVTLVVLAGSVGAFPIGFGEVVSSVLHRIGLDVGTPPDALADDVLWEIRFPRVALTVLVGGSLGCAGALMQGTFSNPLAEPGIVGVSSGAALGAVIIIVSGLAPFGTWSITVAAFVGGRGHRLRRVRRVARRRAHRGRHPGAHRHRPQRHDRRRARAADVLLRRRQLRSHHVLDPRLDGPGDVEQGRGRRPAGHRRDAARRRPSPAGSTSSPSATVRPATSASTSSGTRRSVLLLVAVLTASAVAVSGQILFVGLVIPHLVRMVAGPGHRLLVPASALAGATILVGADLAARTIAAPAEIPLGVLTALVGSPFFFWQLRRTAGQPGRLGVRLAERLGARRPGPRVPIRRRSATVALEARRRRPSRWATVARSCDGVDRSTVARRRGRRPGRPERRRQVDPARRAHRRRRAGRRRGGRGRRAAGRLDRRRAGPAPRGAAPAGGVTFPFTVREVVEMGRGPVGRPRRRPRRRRGRRCLPGPVPTSPTSPTAPSRPCPAASGRGPPWPGCWPRTPGVLLLDEPTAALDLHHQELVLRLARSGPTVGVAVVVVLHDLGLAAAHADRIVVPRRRPRSSSTVRPPRCSSPPCSPRSTATRSRCCPTPAPAQLIVLPVRADLP